MLDQDTARALLTIADETGARVASGRGPAPAPRRRPRRRARPRRRRHADPTAVVTLESVHRFTDPAYADLTLRCARGDDPGAVFDALCRRGQIVSTPPRSNAPRPRRTAERSCAGSSACADRRHPRTGRRPQRRRSATSSSPPRIRRATTVDGGRDHAAGERIGVGDRVATRRNDPDLGVANRETWTVTGIGTDGEPSPCRTAEAGPRDVPAGYAAPVRRARLRHHRLRRPRRDRPTGTRR